MSSTASPSEMRSQIVERLTGAVGDPKDVTDAARSLGERCAPMIADALAPMFATAVGFTCVDVETVRFCDSRPPAGGEHAMTIAAADNSPDALFITLDGNAISIALSAMFGGDPDDTVATLGRAPSAIELDVAAQVMDAVARAFNGSGERSMRIRFPLPAPIAGADIERQVVRDGPAARMDIDLVFGANRGRMTVTMPQRVLLELRGEGRSGAKASPAAWRERFSDEVMRSAVELEATLPLGTLTLGELARLQVGQVLELTAEAPSQTMLAAKVVTRVMISMASSSAAPR